MLRVWPKDDRVVWIRVQFRVVKLSRPRPSALSAGAGAEPRASEEPERSRAEPEAALYAASRKRARAVRRQQLPRDRRAHARANLVENVEGVEAVRCTLTPIICHE